MGARIRDDVQYAWVLASSAVKATRASGEKKRMKLTRFTQKKLSESINCTAQWSILLHIPEIQIAAIEAPGAIAFVAMSLLRQGHCCDPEHQKIGGR